MSRRLDQHPIKDVLMSIPSLTKFVPRNQSWETMSSEILKKVHYDSWVVKSMNFVSFRDGFRNRLTGDKAILRKLRF